MDKRRNRNFRESILRTRGVCAILTILLSGCLLLGLMLCFIWLKGVRVYSATSYKAPDSELTLEVRRWVENKPDGSQGWDFVLISPDEDDLLLERTHALASAFITEVDWDHNAVTIYTRAPTGSLTLKWD